MMNCVRDDDDGPLDAALLAAMKLLCKEDDARLVDRRRLDAIAVAEAAVAGKVEHRLDRAKVAVNILRNAEINESFSFLNGLRTASENSDGEAADQASIPRAR